MFEFLFGKKPTKKAATETLRQTAERSLKELNAVLAALPEQPAVTVRGAGEGIAIDWPEQMPDEAKALPAPRSESDTPKASEPAVEEAADGASDTGQPAETKAA
jgi:hypothetical protein